MREVPALAGAVVSVVGTKSLLVGVLAYALIAAVQHLLPVVARQYGLWVEVRAVRRLVADGAKRSKAMTFVRGHGRDGEPSATRVVEAPGARPDEALAVRSSRDGQPEGSLPRFSGHLT